MPVKPRLLGIIACGVACVATPATAGATTFANPSPITVPDSPGVGVSMPALLYPSPIAVSGQVGTTTNVAVTITGLTHQSPGDLGIALVAPNGEAFLLQDCVGGGAAPITNVSYAVTDAAASQLTGDFPWPPGSYRAGTDCVGSAFPAPGPGALYANPGPEGGGTATFASTFNGDPPNGAWNLYVIDHDPGGTGAINGGWLLDVTSADSTPPETTITKGPKKKTTKKKATFEFTVSEPGSTAECRLDKKAFAPCSSPAKVKVKETGRHTFAVRGRDAAGNIDASPATYKWKVKPR